MPFNVSVKLGMENAMKSTISDSSIPWRVGTCGISDSDWTGNFYPRGLPNIDRLAYYAKHFNSIELNTTFHAMPKPGNVRRWENVTPPDFRFSIKFLKELTHGPPDRLLEAGTLETAKCFFDVIQGLGQKLAVVLMQFSWEFSAIYYSTLLRFLDRISCPARLAIEFREDSWWTPETARALQERGIGWVAADLGSHPRIAETPSEEQLESFGLRPVIPTTNFLYARCLGKHHQFPVHVEEYFDSTPRVTWWFNRFKQVLETNPNVHHVYAFFDNDFSGHAPSAARRFADQVNLPRFWKAPSDQPTLFSFEDD
jgi:uncharacterized protein YecE (DUF72 family)